VCEGLRKVEDMMTDLGVSVLAVSLKTPDAASISLSSASAPPAAGSEITPNSTSEEASKVNVTNEGNEIDTNMLLALTENLATRKGQDAEMNSDVNSSSSSSSDLIGEQNLNPKKVEVIWCHMVSGPPRTDFHSLSPPAVMPPHVNSLITNAYSWFSCLADEYFECTNGNYSIAAVDSMIGYCADNIFTSKRVFETYGGCLGQALLLMPAGYTNVDAEDANDVSNAALVFEHFGRAKPRSQSHSSAEARALKPEVSLVQVRDDPLRFMLLTNSPSHASFKLLGNRVPYRVFLLAMMNSREYRRTDSIFTNSREGSGGVMVEMSEILTSGAMCAASHMGGLAGVPFWTFLEQLAYEMSVPPLTRSETPALSIAHEDLFAARGPCHRFLDMIVPYMSPASQEWPEYVSNHYNVQEIKMTRRGDCFDIMCGARMSAEVKSQSKVLTAKRLTRIFSKIPENSLVHFVPVQSLLNSYITNSLSEGLNWDKLVEQNSKLTDAIVLAIDTSTCQYLEVPGLTDSSMKALGGCEAQRLIIFLCLDFEGKVTQRKKSYANVTFPPYSR